MASGASTQTVPMLIYNTGRGSAPPALNAAATVMALTTIVISAVGYLVYRAVSRREQIAEAPAAGALGPALGEAG